MHKIHIIKNLYGYIANFLYLFFNNMLEIFNLIKFLIIFKIIYYYIILIIN